MKTPTTIDSALKDSPDFKNLINLLAIYSEATARNTGLQAEIDQERIAIVDEHKDDYAANQKALSESESAIEAIIARNPSWFEKRKSLKTPYGEIKTTAGTKLCIPSEEATIRLIHAEGKATDFIRKTEEVDKEALEKLTDDQLAKFGVSREKTSSVKIIAASIDLGEAVKESSKLATA